MCSPRRFLKCKLYLVKNRSFNSGGRDKTPSQGGGNHVFMRTHCFSNENVFMHIGGTIHQFLTRDDSCPINLTLNLKNYTFTYCSRKNYRQIHTIFMVSVLLNPETQNKNIAKFRLIPWLEDCLQHRVKCCRLQRFHCCQCNSQSDAPMETFAESHKTARF